MQPHTSTFPKDGSATEREAWRQKRRDHLQLLTKQPVTPEELSRWGSMLHQVWSDIAWDVSSAMAEQGAKLTRAIIIETVLDANRPMTNGGMTAEEYDYLCHVADKPKIRKWLRETLNY